MDTSVWLIEYKFASIGSDERSKAVHVMICCLANEIAEVFIETVQDKTSIPVFIFRKAFGAITPRQIVIDQSVDT